MRVHAFKMGRPELHKLTIIYDISGDQLRFFSPSFVSQLTKRVSLEKNHYPEVVKRAIICNVSSTFSTIWDLFSRLLDEGSRKKVQFYSANQLPHALFEIVAPEQLPSFLGGTLVDEFGNGDCHGIISPGGSLPFLYQYHVL